MTIPFESATVAQPDKYYTHESLTTFAVDMLRAVGLTDEQSQQMVLRMLDADLLGHRTHGLWFLSTYLERITAGQIRSQGDIDVISETPASLSWQANRLPGAWVMHRAIGQLLAKVETSAIAVATIADCSHIGCLQSYLLPFVEKNLMVMLSATNAGIASVAPFGGIDPVLTTNPLSFGIPTRGEPILIDQCTSLASNSFFTAFAKRGEPLPGQWLLNAAGEPTTDAGVLSQDPPGTILPLGGLDFGYKGFGLGLAVEALTLALPGSGRLRRPDKFGQGVFIQAFNPALLGGLEDYLDETDHLAQACRASRVRAGAPPVRLPGERALRSRREQLVSGVAISEEVHERLAPWTAKLGIKLPGVLTST